ncbi:unannotated protein [freshwater metagenome]|uniref:Unannotated protein n=1 Tax=freshwater metagenome TaxID=449393 RepID=A0A6J7HLY7_9ZZZZ|nr:DUF1345 domain-containing protein [Actinomycetota bacterium]
MSKRGHHWAAGIDREERVEAPLAILPAVAFQVLLATVSLANDWQIWGLPGWVWLLAVAPEIALMLALSLPVSRRHLERTRSRRAVSVTLVVVMGVVNAFALIVLIGSLLSSHEQHGGELLLKGLTIWGTNVLSFALLFWELDGGGPDARRGAPPGALRDFQFPQMENPQLARPQWQPHLLDYVYLSFTNSIAFSPTDAMPLSPRVKMLMLAESGLSVVAVLLVAARAVNILV